MDVHREDWQSGMSFPASNLYMLDNEIATDVTFSFPHSTMKLRAHKIILMSRSSVFFAMFSSGLQDTRKDVIIEDIGPDVFHRVLRYMYSGCVKDLHTDISHMLYTAEKYSLKSLKTECLHSLAGMIRETTVGWILEHGLLYCDNTLVNKCLSFLSTPVSGIRGLKHLHVSKSALTTILNCETLSISRVKYFETCNTWAHDECKVQDIDPSAANRRAVLGDLMQTIPFLSMSSEEFATHVSPVGLLTLEEEVDIFRFVSKKSESSHGARKHPKYRIPRKAIFLRGRRLDRN